MIRILIAIILLAYSAAPAFCWGASGHLIVADVASRHLSPVAKREVAALLRSEGYTALNQISMWADIVKFIDADSQPSHVVKLPLDHSPYDEKKNCANRRCAVLTIEKYREVLRDRTKPTKERMKALKYLVHFVADVHQPLHDTVDTGTRVVRIDGKNVRMHEVWDNEIIKHKSLLWFTLNDRVDSGSQPVLYGTPALWAEEGRDIARDVIFKDGRLRAGKEVVKLPESYLDENWPIVRKRLRQAGYRLAYLLNDALGGTAAIR